ncbi:SDR family NAD(P)-dependent oxidoreductase [Bradyrhizobium sp. 186]|uniref:SDR family NAD(P)-dependent oxidoreductase n=1 Tax=Bradyrhizobium sp. 186 TaxID=2782654 RepID=UPI002001C04B|nr:SDR family NAD(P)-dependent oxidoreductase [Bradyrhizobium sp. 186]UPK38557.1 SDR family NAD(P)-dependent oxidoreductase [Bradyrhizobium sp. 186]
MAPVGEFYFAKWKQMLAIHLDGAFLTTHATLREMYKTAEAVAYLYGFSAFQRSIGAKAPYVTAKHGLIGPANVVGKEGAKDGVGADVTCPEFVRTPLVQSNESLARVRWRRRA